MTAKQFKAIEAHGNNLLVIFPATTVTDPIELCKKLRRLEAQAHAFGLRLCNGPEFASEDEPDSICEKLLDKVNALLGYRSGDGVPVFVNRDPRGYALKISECWMTANKVTRLHRDWGGYGILAPEFNKDGQ